MSAAARVLGYIRCDSSKRSTSFAMSMGTNGRNKEFSET